MVRPLRSKTSWIVLAVLALALAVGVGVAAATLTQSVVTDTNSVRLRIVHSDFVPSDDQPEFSSGWHTHPGPVIVQVQQGYLKITQATCNPNVIGPGETYVETPGLAVLATANKEVHWTTSMILPGGVDPATPLASGPC
jgi:quercetin dioxygenase-like cupin family protein